MNKRQAKRRASYLAGAWIEDAIAMGFESIHTDDEDNALPQADSLRIEAALHELSDELFCRSMPPQGT